MRSMTGFGRSQVRDAGFEITVELKSVNHRFLDVSCRLPRSLTFLEEIVRKRIAAVLKRGHVDAFVAVACSENASGRVSVDEPLALAYADAAKRLSALTGREDDVSVAQLMGMEGVVTLVDAPVDQDAVGALCAKAADGAVAALDAMRVKEGAAMQADLSAHLTAAADLREQILTRAPLVTQDYRDRLTARLAKLPMEPVEPQRLAQEVALLADHCAVDEELARLDSHIRQMRGYLTGEGELGKKMDFLIQEMNREANTIGSKANDAQIAQLVVALKSEIEKLREQIQNVE